MENLSGGDLFTYLEKRKFTVSEHRAKIIAHQIATALYYLHSFGVAHRDLKPENILMADNSENTDLKIVDFGLSKIIGPNETSLDPFGTLVSKNNLFIIIAFSLMLLQKFFCKSHMERKSIFGAWELLFISY